MTYRVHPGQTRPANLRELRELVARRGHPRASAVSGSDTRCSLRRTTWLLDEAEAEFATGSVAVGVARALLAVLNTPAIFLSPLVGPWTVRRLGGRLARRFQGEARTTG